MQVVSGYSDGVFSWLDLGTTDPEAAKASNGDLFGWLFQDMPADSGVVYSIAKLDGYNVTGLATARILGATAV